MDAKAPDVHKDEVGPLRCHRSTNPTSQGKTGAISCAKFPSRSELSDCGQVCTKAGTGPTMDTNAHLRELGLDVSADREDLVVAYRRMMLQWHPARNPAPESADVRWKNQAIAEAYRTLAKSSALNARSKSAGPVPDDIAATYGAPRLEKISFTPTSLQFSPATTISEASLARITAPASKTPAASPADASSPIDPASIIGGVILILVAGFVTVRDEQNSVSSTPSPSVTKTAKETPPAEKRAAAPPATTAPSLASGEVLGRSNRPNVVITLIAPDGTTRTASQDAKLGYRFSDLAPGEYRLNAQLTGWEKITRLVKIEPGQHVDLPLEFKGGSLRLESDPAGATVKLQGNTVGKTPLVISDLPPGPKELVLQYGSWPELTVGADVIADTETPKTIRFPRGRLTIESTPLGALVLIDGKELGRTPLVLDPIPSGNRRIQLKADDYETYETSIALADGVALKIHPALSSNLPVFDPKELLRQVWVSSQRSGREYDVAPAFERSSSFSPRNGVIKNLDRQKLFSNWFDRKYRHRGVVKQFDAKTGKVEFVDGTDDRAKYKVVAILSPQSRTNKDFENRLLKGASIEIAARFTAAEEPRWPAKTITFELGDAELLQ